MKDKQCTPSQWRNQVGAGGRSAPPGSIFGEIFDEIYISDFQWQNEFRSNIITMLKKYEICFV